MLVFPCHAATKSARLMAAQGAAQATEAPPQSADAAAVERGTKEEHLEDAQAPTTPPKPPRTFKFSLDELPPSPSQRKKGLTSPRPPESPVVKAFEANLEEMQKWRKRALDAESKLWGSAKEQSLAYQAASKWKGFKTKAPRSRSPKKTAGTPPRPSRSPARSRSPVRYSEGNAREARRLAKQLLGELEGLGADHASIRASLRGALAELTGEKRPPAPSPRSARVFTNFKATPTARRTPPVRTPSDYVISGKRRSHYEKAIAAARTVGTRRKERASFGSPPHKRGTKSPTPPVST